MSMLQFLNLHYHNGVLVGILIMVANVVMVYFAKKE